jgi:hypothetical protein
VGFLPRAEAWLGSDWGKGGNRWKTLLDTTAAGRQAGRQGGWQLVEPLRQPWALMQREAGVATGAMPVGGGKEKLCFLHHAEHELIGGKGKGGQHLLTAERERAVFRGTSTRLHSRLGHSGWRRAAWFACGKFATAWVTTMSDSTTSLPNHR